MIPCCRPLLWKSLCIHHSWPSSCLIPCCIITAVHRGC
jgi:hypothetical protein